MMSSYWPHTYTDIDHARIDTAQANWRPNNRSVCQLVQHPYHPCHSLILILFASQSHSTLHMYQEVDDPKSSLIRSDVQLHRQIGDAVRWLVSVAIRRKMRK